MEASTYIALSRQGGLRRQMDVVANNLANMNTAGFKGEKMMFVEHLVRSKNIESALGEKNAYVRDIATRRDFSKGSLETTGNPLDFGISGDGFFTIQTQFGTQYTRNGHFQLDQDGQLVTETGDPVLAEGDSPIFFAPGDTKIVVARDGTISTLNGELGKLSVVTFENMQSLKPGASGLFKGGNPVAAENPSIHQGMLEDSNIQPIIEMSYMIGVHRAYDNMKMFLEREDQRMRDMAKGLAQAV
jgi:flagellar basal-body rod protein FlgF